MAGPDGGRGIPRELSRDEIDDFLRSQRIARLGCHGGGVTYVVPLIYAYEDGAVVAVTTEGRKTAMLRENPRVVRRGRRVRRRRPGSWRSVIAQGSYEELAGDAIEPALALLRERFARTAGRDAEPRPLGPDVVVLRIRLEEMSGPGRRAVISLRKQGIRLCSEIEKHSVWEWTSVQRRSITRMGGGDRAG